MLQPRHVHTATLLTDGTVLITGGITYNPDAHYVTAEVYDPATGTFSFADGFMSVARIMHSAMVLVDGRVLIDGGDGSVPSVPADIYDPVTRTFSQAGAPQTNRYQQPGTLLSDGRVLFAGAYDDDSVEVYDPVAGTYSTLSDLTIPRALHTSTLLPDTRVLVVGGSPTCPTACSTEVFDPVTQTFSAGSRMSVGRAAHTATLLDDGTVLVVGGQANGLDTASAELFDPLTNTFTAAGAMAGTRWGQTATLLNDGAVLLVGGLGPLAGMGAELYVPTAIAATSLFVTPSSATMQPGQSRSFAVVDQLGQPRTDALWSVDNANLATVDPMTGVVSAVSSGSVVLTATVGATMATAPITVAPSGALSGGTIRWSVAAPAGFTSKHVVQGVADSIDAPALFSVSGTATETHVQALTFDGQQLWQTWLPGQVSDAGPDGAGGMLLTMYGGSSCDSVNPLQIVSLDGATGIWAWHAVSASVCMGDVPQIALRSDRTVVVATPGNFSGLPGLMMLDLMGNPLSVPAIPPSTFTSVNGQLTSGYSRVGPPMVDPDGVVHMLYEKRFLAYPPEVVNTGIWMMTVNTNQTFSMTQLNSTTDNTNLFPGHIIPDAHGGLLATWIDSPIVPAGQPPAQSTLRAARISSGGGISLYDVPLTLPAELLLQPGNPLPVNPELTLGENDTVFVSYAGTIASFGISGGVPG